MTPRTTSGTVTAPAARAARSRVPSLREERRLLRSGHLLVAGMDEVGRGALAGPVTVGVVVVDAAVRTAPSGVRDSKLLTPAAREALVPRLRRWAVASAVGHAEPAEIDRYGIIAALRLAGRRALAQLPEVPTCVLLDGSHDWLSPPRPRRAASAPVTQTDEDAASLFDLDADLAACLAAARAAALGAPARPGASGRPGDDADGALAIRPQPPVVPLACEPTVLTRVKADLRCAAVAAASVLAKVERDAIMVRRAEDFPVYGWHENKGYSAPNHVEALAQVGPCVEHRRSWSLPGFAGPPDGDGGTMLIDLGLLDRAGDGTLDAVLTASSPDPLDALDDALDGEPDDEPDGEPDDESDDRDADGGRDDVAAEPIVVVADVPVASVRA